MFLTSAGVQGNGALSGIDEFHPRSGGKKERIMDKDVNTTPEPNDPAKQPETFPGIRIEPLMDPPGQDEIDDKRADSDPRPKQSHLAWSDLLVSKGSLRQTNGLHTKAFPFSHFTIV